MQNEKFQSHESKMDDDKQVKDYLTQVQAAD